MARKDLPELINEEVAYTGAETVDGCAMPGILSGSRHDEIYLSRYADKMLY